ncbi:MAG: transposase [Bacteroidota bacterium]
MPSKYKVYNNDRAYFMTITVVHWIDLFTRSKYEQIMVDALAYCQRHKGLEIFGWCLMSNHLHLIARAADGHDLAMIIRDFKKYTAKALIRQIQTGTEGRREWLLTAFRKACLHLRRDQQFKVWRTGYHAIELFSNKFIYQKLEYIHANPVRAQYVAFPEDYLYSSARNYAGLSTVMDVDCLPAEMRTVAGS